MMMKWKNIALSKVETLRDAMRILDAGGLRVVLVVDADDKLEGVITDGDIRRGLLKGLSMDARVDTVMNRRPLVAFPDANPEYIRNLMMNKLILTVPIVDVTNRVVGLETIDTVAQFQQHQCDVVLMAGGFGQRLHPLTKNCPKPLLTLGNKPILECIIQDFMRQGFSRFFISTHYKSDQIKSYFGDGSELGCKIDYIHEEKPLGTAGALAYLPNNISNDFIVMNADVVAKINFQDLLSFHQEQGRIATLCIRKIHQQSPYGVVTLEYPYVSGLQEKPAYSHFVNAGIYVFKNSVLDKVKKAKPMDMTALLGKFIDQGKNVVAFPIHEYWIDIGRVDDYEKVMDGI